MKHFDSMGNMWGIGIVDWCRYLIEVLSEKREKLLYEGNVCISEWLNIFA